MSALAIISELSGKGVNIRIKGSELVLSAPKGALTPKLVSMVKQEKPAIIESLSNPRQSVDRLARKLLNHNRDELQELAGDDWPRLIEDAVMLVAFASLEATQRIRASGNIPDSYSSTTSCMNCGVVPIFSGCPPEVQACPWCMNGQSI